MSVMKPSQYQYSYLMSSFECLIAMSNSTYLKLTLGLPPNTQFLAKSDPPRLTYISVDGNSILPVAHAKTMKLPLTPLFLSHSTSNLSRNPIGSIFSLQIHTLILLTTYSDTTLLHVSIRFYLEYCNYLLGTSLLLHLAPCILVSTHEPYDTFKCASQIMPLLCLQYFNGSPPNSENTKSLQRSVRPYMTSPIPPSKFLVSELL